MGLYITLNSQYDIEGLRQLCIYELHGNIDPANAVAILRLAYLYHATSVKKAALSFIRE